MNSDYNVLSDNAYQEKMFDFNLQLFGGGGGGKRGVKIIGTIAAACFGYFNATSLFGFATNMSIGGAFMGAALFSSIWSATKKQNTNLDGTANIQRFERAQETMTSNGSLPVVYGRRQVSGNQTYHKTNSDASVLYKHVVLCEGGIEGIESVCANDLLIPTGSQTSNTVFTLQNVKYKDATVMKKGKTLTLSANGKTRSVFLCTTDDLNSDNTFFDYQVSISSLISWINRLGEGWQAFPTASTNLYPGNLWDVLERTSESIVWLTGNDLHELGRPNSIFPEKEFDAGGAHYQLISYRDNKFEYKRVQENTLNAYYAPVNFQIATVTGETSYTFYDGVTPSNYEEVGGYPNMAWLDMKFTISGELNGNPNVSCLVKGRKVYDLRTGKTEYSTNPALCVRDFILSQRYGMGTWFGESHLDDDSWIEAANYCDELITLVDGSGAKVSVKRYELNMIIDSKRSAVEWLQEMLSNFCGYLVYSNGVLKLKIEKETPVSYKFNDSNCSNLKISPLALSETPNRYEVTIIDPLNNWTSVKCLCDDYVDQRERQKIISKAVSLEGVTSQNQALRLARFYRDYNLVCPIQLSFTTGLQAIHLEPGDVVTIDYHDVFTNMPIRISEIKETNKGTFEISGRQYNSSIYGDFYSGGINWYNYSTLNSPYTGEIPDVFNLTYNKRGHVTQTGVPVYTVDLEWNKVKYQYFAEYVIEYKSLYAGKWSYDNAWITYGSTTETSCSVNVQLSNPYVFRVRVKNTAGKMSNGVCTEFMTIDGIFSPPSQVKGLSYEVVNGGINIKWNANKEYDIKGYNVYYGIGNTALENCNLAAENYAGNSLYVPIEIAQDYIFYVIAVNNMGYTSKPSAPCIAHIAPLPDVTGFFAVKNGDNIQFFWDEIKGCNYEIRWGSSWTAGKVVAKINSNVYTLFFPLIGTQTFFIKAYNAQKLFSANPTWINVNLTPTTTRNVVAEFDEGKNGWTGTKNFLTKSGKSLVMNSDVRVAEYYTSLHLNKKADARNWIEYYTSFSEGNVTWEDIDECWDDYDVAWLPIASDAIVNVENFISRNVGHNYLYDFDLNGNTKGSKTAKGISYDDCRFTKGVLVKANTTLDYKVNIPSEFHLSFNARIKNTYNNCMVFMTLEGDKGWLRVKKNTRGFILADSMGTEIVLSNYCNEDDILNFYVQQTQDKRIFKVTNIAKNKESIGEIDVSPIGEYKEMRLSP